MPNWLSKASSGRSFSNGLILQNKSTLGSASSCALRCQLPGIAAYHALLVIGARQVFIRALAPKMSRNGVMVNELLLTEEQSSFEVAGHQFELIRDVRPSETTASKKTPLGRMKFALARPMEIGQPRSDATSNMQIWPQARKPLRADGSSDDARRYGVAACPCNGSVNSYRVPYYRLSVNWLSDHRAAGNGSAGTTT